MPGCLIGERCLFMPARLPIRKARAAVRGLTDPLA